MTKLGAAVEILPAPPAAGKAVHGTFLGTGVADAKGGAAIMLHALDSREIVKVAYSGIMTKPALNIGDLSAEERLRLSD